MEDAEEKPKEIQKGQEERRRKKKLSKSCQFFSKRPGRWKKQRKIKKGRRKKKEKNEGFPRPGGDFVAPGKKKNCSWFFVRV
jgi:hypothetical protein